MALSRYEHTGAAPQTGLASGIGATDTTFTVNSGTGYPTGAVGKFVICLDANTASEEKILCSARSGTSFTVAASGRGYDGTTAASHSSGSTNVTHVLSAAEIDDTSDHIYTTTRDDHTQYAKADGTRSFTGLVTAPDFTASGLTGATAASRYVGATTSGSPASGTFAAGDFVIDQTGAVWVCTTAGTVGSGCVFGQVGGTTDAAWTALTLNTGWTNLGGSTLAASYRRVNGRVYVRGTVVRGSGAGNNILTLPYAPSGTLTFTAAVTSQSPINSIVTTGGVVQGSGVTGDEVDLSCISFDTL